MAPGDELTQVGDILATNSARYGAAMGEEAINSRAPGLGPTSLNVG